MAVIGINILFLIPNQVGGTEYLTRSFLAALEQVDRANSYIVFCNRENFPTFKFNNSRWRKVLCNVPAASRWRRIAYEQIILPVRVWREGCSVLHSFGYFGPTVCPVPQIVTVHDANWQDHPEDTALAANLVSRLLIGLTLHTSAAIVTDSEFSRRRLRIHFPWLKQKLKVVQPAVDENFLRLSAAAVDRQTKRPYFLCVSGFYPHKRIPFLLRSWKKIIDAFPEHELVLVGGNGSDEVEVRSLVGSMAQVKHYRKVPLTELVELYRGADALLLPSTYEGFGFPVYEAAVSGIPIVVADKTMYDRRLNDLLVESTFVPENLKERLKKLPKRRWAAPDMGSYARQAEKLVKIYEHVSQQNTH